MQTHEIFLNITIKIPDPGSDVILVSLMLTDVSIVTLIKQMLVSKKTVILKESTVNLNKL